MDKAVDLVLKKLEEIEKRIIKLEGKKEGEEVVDKEVREPTGLAKKDPLFNRAWEIVINEQGDVSVSFLAQKLNVSEERASQIMDQLAEAGFGVCYTKEV